MRNVISRGMDAALRALVTARQLKSHSRWKEAVARRLLLNSLRVYTIVIFSQTELRTRMRATLDGTVLQDHGKPLYSVSRPHHSSRSEQLVRFTLK